MAENRLTDVKCRTAKAGPVAFRLFDGGGLYLQVQSSGSRLWRLKYRIDGKEKLLSFGSYPEVSLATARERRTDARRQLSNGIDPALKRKAERQSRQAAASNTLEAIAREWHGKKAPRWADSHSEKVLHRLEKNVFPWLGGRILSDLEAPDFLSVLKRMESRGVLDSTRRVRQYLSAILRYAIATGRAKYNVAADLVGSTAEPVPNHYASITDPVEIGKLLRAMDAYDGSIVTRTALNLAPILFCRPGELRGMQWAELDFQNALWRIPPARQKLKTAAKKSPKTADFLVPLPRQAVRLLEEIRPVTGGSEFVFPSERSRKRSMSDGTVNAALRRLGYSKEQITGHGFRHMASTLLNEQGDYSPDAIEKQLSHKDRDRIRGIYNQAKYLSERTKMMQAWADYLDRLRGTPLIA